LDGALVARSGKRFSDDLALRLAANVPRISVIYEVLEKGSAPSETVLSVQPLKPLPVAAPATELV
jgi:hypothetical protein